MLVLQKLYVLATAKLAADARVHCVAVTPITLSRMIPDWHQLVIIFHACTHIPSTLLSLDRGQTESHTGEWPELPAWVHLPGYGCLECVPA